MSDKRTPKSIILPEVTGVDFYGPEKLAPGPLGDIWRPEYESFFNQMDEYYAGLLSSTNKQYATDVYWTCVKNHLEGKAKERGRSLDEFVQFLKDEELDVLAMAEDHMAAVYAKYEPLEKERQETERGGGGGCMLPIVVILACSLAVGSALAKCI